MTVRLLLVLACVTVPGWVLVTRWSTVLNDHPAYLALLVALSGTGVVLALRTRPPAPRCVAPRRADRGGRVQRPAARRRWLAPAVRGDAPVDDDVGGRHGDRLAGPVGAATGPAPLPVGLVFSPGARVDPRAYLALLRPLASAGHLVVVIKPPLDIALLAGGPGATFDAHPEVVRWVVGGHSLGGTAAASTTGDPRIVGLVHWASYPAGDMSGSGLSVLSISGDRDGLATSADIVAARPLLPSSTGYVVVRGGVHAYFGDGPQPDDGVPGVDRTDAQRQITSATAAFVASR